MDWRGGFENYQPVFQKDHIAPLKARSTSVLVSTLKLAYDSFYRNRFMGSMDARNHKELAITFLNGLFCYLRGVSRLKDEKSSRSVLPHFIANPILNALLESDNDDLIYLFCAQANLSITELLISPKLNIQPVIFEAFKQFNIQTIDISNCNFVNENTIFNLTQSETIQNSLVSLKMRGCRNLKFLPDLSKLRYLATLDISEIVNLELPGYQNNPLLDKLCILLYQLPSLKNLSTFSNGLLENNYSTLVSANNLYKMWCRDVLLNSKLEYLDISVYSVYQMWLSSCTVVDFLLYIVLLPKLDSLDVSGWHITSQTFFSVFTRRKAFKFLGLLDTVAFIESNSFSNSVTNFSDIVTSLSTHDQILNSLKAYLEIPNFLKIVLQRIENTFENTITLDKDLVAQYMEAFVKIINIYHPGLQDTTIFQFGEIIDDVIYCIWLFTRQFSVVFTQRLVIRLIKNCFVLYNNEQSQRVPENLSKIISSLITPDTLKMEELFPFYFAMIKFILNLMQKFTLHTHIMRLRNPREYRMANELSEFLNILTIELPTPYLTWVGTTYRGVSVIVNYIFFAMRPMAIPMVSVHQFENLWAALRNLVYMSPENCIEFLNCLKYDILKRGYCFARKKQWQEVINLIVQSLENVIECWILDIVRIVDTQTLNFIEDFLLNKIIFFMNDDDQFVCTFASIMIFLTRMFERSNKVLPEYLLVGLDLVAENLPNCDIVYRVKRHNLTAILDCTSSKERNVVTCANWLIDNYLKQDSDYYSKIIELNMQALNPDVIIID